MAAKQHKKKRGKKADKKAGTKLATKTAGGRPVELTEAVLQRIADHVNTGAYLETAANIEGFSIESMRKLLARGTRALRRREKGKDIGKDADGNELDETQKRLIARSMRFAMMIRKASARSEKADLDFIATSDQWQARAWRLERKFPERYQKRDHVDHKHAGPKGGPIQVAALQIAPDQFREMIRDLSEEEIEIFERVFLKLGPRGSSSPGNDPGGAGAPSG